jgi:hypothetical protein
MDAEQVRSSAIAHECAVFEDFVEALRNFRSLRGDEDEETLQRARSDLDEMNARWEVAWREADTADAEYAQFLLDDISITRLHRRAEQTRRIQLILT